VQYNILINHSGIHAKFLNGLLNVVLYPDISGLYFNCIDPRTNPAAGNIFDWVLSQSLDVVHNSIHCQHLYNYTNEFPIYRSPMFPQYKHFLDSMIRIQPDLISEVNYWADKLGITENTIGIHVRLCDMNIQHGNDYGVKTLHDYLKHMTFGTNYFVSSDNHRCIDVMQGIFGDQVTSVPNLIRGKDEQEDTSVLQLENFSNPRFWQESFLEALLLSKCGKLICRTSSVSQSAMLFSNSIKEIIRI